MQISDLLIFLLPSIALTAAYDIAIGQVPSNTSNPISTLRNGSLAFPSPPAGFDVTYEIGGPKLHQTALLMNTVAALKTLALGAWDARVSDGTQYKLSTYPQVSISVNTPKRLRTIEASYIVWAITKGVLEILSSGKIQLSQFELRLWGTLLGWIHVVPNKVPKPFLVEGGGTSVNESLDTVGRRNRLLQPSIEATSSGGFNFTNPTTAGLVDEDDPNEDRLNTTFTPFGKTLTIYDVFVPIIDGLTEVARYDTTSRTQVFIEEIDEFEGCVCLRSVPLFRSEKPFFEHGWITRTMARIPEYMIQERRFGEIKIRMEVDGVEIGSGLFGTLESCAVGPSQDLTTT